MLSDLTECAYRLGVAFGAEAERAETTGRALEYFKLFDRCFFSVRVAIALKLRLGRAAPALAAERDEPEHDAPERDPSEAERPERERLGYEYDREREVEQASLPVLLKTLAGVAADAAALPGPPPADLPTLQELLAQFSGGAEAPPPGGEGAGVGVLTRPPKAGVTPTRSRLLASALTRPPQVSAKAPWRPDTS